MAVPEPARIAHRGASGYAPENTMASFRRAFELGARSVEFDVQQTKDGRLVVIHDLDLKRVAGDRRKVGALAWEELAALDVGSWFGERFSGEKVPDLDSFLDLAEAQGNGVELQLEVKQPSRPYPSIEERLLETLKRRPAWGGRIVFSSFHHPTLRRLRSLDARARLGYLVGLTSRSAAVREAVSLGCESLHLSLRRADKNWVGAAKENGLKVLVYTVNKPSELKSMSRLGVDGVFTNFPDLEAA